MRRDRQAALALRLSGKSYGEIRQALGVPKSTLSGWFSDIVLSERLRERIERRGQKQAIAILLQHNKNQTTLAVARAARTRQEAAGAIRNPSPRELLLLGVVLYWAEGYKRPLRRNGRTLTHHVVSLTNSDPYLVKAFLRFLRESCGVPNGKIKASLRIFEHQNENTLLRYWQKETGIPPHNFKKSYVGISKSSAGKRPFNQLPFGVIQIVVADTALFHRIIGYIEGIKRFV